MFEAKLLQGGILKKVVDALKELVTDANFSCSPSGFSLQAMDSSHVALVCLLLKENGFEHYRCDHNMNLGINIIHMGKILKSASNEDSITIQANHGQDKVIFIIENTEDEKMSKFELSQMEIDCEHLGIPETDYNAVVKMPSSEFSRIMRDLSGIGEQLQISITKEGIKFSTVGDIANAEIVLRPRAAADNEANEVMINMKEGVSLPFAVKYLNTFAKAAPLSPTVKIGLSQNCPILIEFPIDNIGHMKYYLAPKMNDEEDTAMDSD